jgi:hypothetical protein
VRPGPDAPAAPFRRDASTHGGYEPVDRPWFGPRLLSLHNLRFVLDLVAGARAAIKRGELRSYKEEALARLQRSPEEATWVT